MAGPRAARRSPRPPRSSGWTRASAAARQIEQWRSEGRTDEAAALEKIARQPVAIWPTGETGGVEGEVAGVVSQARAAGRTPVLTAYNIPNRDCGQYSSGGAGDEGAYREWLDAFARGMGGTRSVVILEPDALPQTLTNCEGQGEQEGREELLAEAVRTLSSARAARSTSTPATRASSPTSASSPTGCARRASRTPPASP